MNTILSYNQLMLLFENFVKAHPVLQSFGNGPASKISKSKATQYPLMWVTHDQDSKITAQNRTTIPEWNFLILFLDKLNNQENVGDVNGEASNNGQEILSDMAQCGFDLISDINNYYGKFGLLFGAPDIYYYPINDEGDDKLNGWAFRMKLKAKQFNCNEQFGDLQFPANPDWNCPECGRTRLVLNSFPLGIYPCGSLNYFYLFDSFNNEIDFIFDNETNIISVKSLPCENFPPSARFIKGIDVAFEPAATNHCAFGIDFFNLNPDEDPGGYYLWPSNGYKRFTGKAGGYHNEIADTFHLADRTTTTKANAFPDGVFLDWAQACWHNSTVPMFLTGNLVYGTPESYDNKLAEIEAATIAGETGWTIPPYKIIYNLSIEFGNNVYRYEPIGNTNNLTINTCTRRSSSLIRGVATVTGNGTSNNISNLGYYPAFKWKQISELT